VPLVFSATFLLGLPFGGGQVSYPEDGLSLTLQTGGGGGRWTAGEHGDNGPPLYGLNRFSRRGGLRPRSNPFGLQVTVQ
jgi:hypothetical protein